jgi:hypothetical protein
MASDEHPEPDPRRPVVRTPEITGQTNDPEPDRRSLSQEMQAAWTRVQESADAFQRVTTGLPERLPFRQLQVAWAHAIEGVNTKWQQWSLRRGLRRVTRRRLRSWRRPVAAMPSMAGLSWRDRLLFGLTGASILLALITIAVVVSDMVGRATP